MGYPDGASGGENANDWFKKTFGKSFGEDWQTAGKNIGNAVNSVFKPWSNTGTINWDGPSDGHPLGLINYRAPENKQSIMRDSSQGPAVSRNPMGGNVDASRDKAMAGRQGMSPNTVNPQDRQGALFDDLLARGTAKWGGVDQSQIDYSPLDKILASRMGLIDQLTGQTNQNFEKSDLALEQMHRGLQNDLNTNGVSRYNKIADDTVNNLQGVQDVSNQRLQAIKDGDMAKRQAMLQALGIQEAGGAVDHSGDVLTDAQANITQHTTDDKAMAEQDRAGNLAFNQGIASSVGQAGVERRGQLQQQLQQVLGKLGMAKTDYQNQDAQQRLALQNQAEQRQYSEFQNERGYARDTAGQMEDRAFQQEQALAKLQQTKTPGFSGLAQDLQNTGYDSGTIQNAMGVLSKVLGSNYMQGINPQEYNATAVINRRLQENGVPPIIASQLATNYGNLGSNNSY